MNYRLMFLRKCLHPNRQSKHPSIYVNVHAFTGKVRIWPISCENFIKMCSHTTCMLRYFYKIFARPWLKSELFLHAQKPREQLPIYSCTAIITFYCCTAII
ncbi:MAG: hypothetical protein K0S63_704 [Gammaproteobacteria bacterium]|nr:hypothetical protein [Gammaproteobacteria bacterium]